MVLRSLLAVVGLAVVGVAGCSDDDEPPATSCASYDHVTGSPSFASDVIPVFQLSCNFSSCHQSGVPNPAQGLALGPASGQVADQATIDAVHASLVGVDAKLANEKLVVAGSPEESFLMAKLHYGDDATFAACGVDCTSCGALMPEGNPTPMDQERRDILAAWIKRGAPSD
jgi:hypothetical protein